MKERERERERDREREKETERERKRASERAREREREREREKRERAVDPHSCPLKKNPLMYRKTGVGGGGCHKWGIWVCHLFSKSTILLPIAGAHSRSKRSAAS